MRKISPSIFGLILLCFFLPFVTISCGGQEIVTFTQWDLIIGTKINTQEVDPNPIAVIILLVVLAGILVSFLKSRAGLILSAMSGVIGFVATLALKFTIDNEIAKQGKRMLEADYRAGFYLSLILFIAAAGFNFYQIMNRERTIPLIPLITGARGEEGFKFCSQCGTRNSASNDFCVECGSKLS